MTATDLLNQRLLNQQIGATTLSTPQQLVSYLGAVQAQEYASAKWALGLRLPGTTEATIEQALTDGAVLRTHVLRPTWHFVAPDDIRWMQQLTAARVHAFNASAYRKEGLDAKIFKRSNDAIAKALEGGKYATRTALMEELQKVKITASGIKLVCLMMYAELECIICSGPREGKQFTYALLDERAPAKKQQFHRDEALAALALRYFTSRTPATARDFAWWSGLTLKDAKTAVATLSKEFETKVMDGEEYIVSQLTPAPAKKMQHTFLMPAFDEYGISYKDRSILKTNADTHDLITKNGGSVPSLVVDGKIAGTWKASIKKKEAQVDIHAYIDLTKTKQHAVTHAVEKYRAYISGK